jgi:hypothetical protein
LHKTLLNEFCQVAFREKLYRSIYELQVDLDLWVRDYNEPRLTKADPATHRSRLSLPLAAVIV